MKNKPAFITDDNLLFLDGLLTGGNKKSSANALPHLKVEDPTLTDAEAQKTVFYWYHTLAGTAL